MGKNLSFEQPAKLLGNGTWTQALLYRPSLFEKLSQDCTAFMGKKFFSFPIVTSLVPVLLLCIPEIAPSDNC